MHQTISSLLAVLVLGCASQSPDEVDVGGGGGKADDATTKSGALRELDESEQTSLRAADAECLHVNYTHHDTYDQSVKLICMPRGGVAAPILTYIAVTPLAESDGAYKVYELPVYMTDSPEAVELRMVGSKAILSFKIQEASAETGDITYETKTVTATLAFSGASEDPTVTGAYSVSP